ncbi:MAG: hypothetical protein U9Q68_03535 [Euryarchaeota archaeon]|nr:hypothetical protein [Euryarchaeota archaeon]
MKDEIIGKITMKSTGDELLKLMSIQAQQKAIPKLFRSENIIKKVSLKPMGIEWGRLRPRNGRNFRGIQPYDSDFCFCVGNLGFNYIRVLDVNVWDIQRHLK